jgi:hypothetical protein
VGRLGGRVGPGVRGRAAAVEGSRVKSLRCPVCAGPAAPLRLAGPFVPPDYAGLDAPTWRIEWRCWWGHLARVEVEGSGPAVEQLELFKL